VKVILKLPKVWGAFLGNFFEHYDTALFTALAPFLAPIFFPHESFLASLIYTYALIPLGMAARPLGAVLFGRVGDRYSRETALFYSMGGMALVSFLLAFCPEGVWGAVILGVGRFLQNLFASGESMGGAIYILEKAPKEKHDLLSSLFSMSTVAGILAASLAVTVLYHTVGVEQGWRLLYLIGCATGLCGMALRRNPDAEKRGERPVSNLLETAWTYRRAIGIIALASGFTYATFSVGLVLMNGFIPLVTPFSKGEMVQLNVFLLAYMMLALPLLGKLATRISRELLMRLALATVVVAAPLLFYLLAESSFSEIVAIRVLLVTLGVAYSSSFHAWAQQLVPKECRYFVVSVGYALGTQLFGGPCSAVSLWLYYATEIPWVASLYWVGLAAANSALFYRLQYYSKLERNSSYDLATSITRNNPNA